MRGQLKNIVEKLNFVGEVKMNRKGLIPCLAILFAGLLGCGAIKAAYAAATMTDFGEKHKEITEIDVMFDSNVVYWNGQPKPMQIKNRKMITDILSMITQSRLLRDESNVEHMSGMASRHNKMLLIAKDNSQKEITFVYDDPAFAVGYIEMDGQKYEADYSFFRYMRDLTEYMKFDTVIAPQVVELFKQYNWAVDYKVNEIKEILPATLKHGAGEYPSKIYWAYNNELSKNIGLDFSQYLGKPVDVEIYRLREPLPDYMRPYMNARGIVLKYNRKIVGAYIDAGRHRSFACSVDKKSLQNITGQDWNGWIDNYIDYSDALEAELSGMNPEDIIKQYYDAMDKHDEKLQFACMTRNHLCMYLSINMDNNELYNPPGASMDYQNVESAKLISLRKVELKDNSGGTITYEAKVDVVFKDLTIENNGVYTRFICLKKETLQSGWRIEEIGTGL